MYGRRGGAALSRAVKTNSHGPDETTARTKPRPGRNHEPEEATTRRKPRPASPAASGEGFVSLGAATLAGAVTAFTAGTATARRPGC